MDDETQLGINFVKTLATKFEGVKKIYLFGSRYRSDHKDTSDFDFAVEWRNRPNEEWAAFALELRDEFPLLNKVDLVRLDQIDPLFKDKILTESTLIYGKN